MALNDVCVSYLYIKDGLNFNGNPENVVLTKNCIAWKLKSKFHFVRIRKGKKEVEKISIFKKMRNLVFGRNKKGIVDTEDKILEAQANLIINESVNDTKSKIRREDIDEKVFTEAYKMMTKLKVKKLTEEEEQIFSKDFSKNMLQREK